MERPRKYQRLVHRYDQGRSIPPLSNHSFHPPDREERRNLIEKTNHLKQTKQREAFLLLAGLSSRVVFSG